MEKFNPLVSIIIPVYNGGNYLKQAIDSALAQTYENIEILVINDGSDDDGKTDDISKSYGEKIRYINKANGGVSSALNVGIDNMNGEYFSWLSHDDVYLPDKILSAINALGKVENKDTIVLCDYIFIDKDSKIIKGKKEKMPFSENKELTYDEILPILLRKGSFNGCALLIPKAAFKNCGKFDEELRFNQDGFMWIKIFLNEYSLIYISEIGVKTRIHSKQMTNLRQDLFRNDCEYMSVYLIPQLLEKSNTGNHYVYEYAKYNAKYGNKNIVSNIFERMNRNELSVVEKFKIWLFCIYGEIRPLIRKIYYKIFRGISTR